MNIEVMAKCPECKAQIDPMNFEFACPVCGMKHDKFDILAVCRNCNFAPRLIVCPHCHQTFEAALLAGYYEKRPPTIVSGTAFSNSNGYVNTFKEMKLFFASQETMDTVTCLGNEAVESFGDLEIRLPVDICRLAFINSHKDAHGINWYHVWAFDSDKDYDPRESPIAQLSLRFPNSKGEKQFEYIVTDIVINK